MSEGNRETEGGKQRNRGMETEKQCLCVCVFIASLCCLLYNCVCVCVSCASELLCRDDRPEGCNPPVCVCVCLCVIDTHPLSYTPVTHGRRLCTHRHLTLAAHSKGHICNDTKPRVVFKHVFVFVCVCVCEREREREREREKEKTHTTHTHTHLLM